MILDFNGLKVRVQIEGEETKASKHTGLNITCLQVVTRIRGREVNEQFLERIGEAKTNFVSSVDEKGNIQKKWMIGNTSWSYQDGTPLYTHSIELEEVEDLRLERLEIGELVVRPYDYHETFEMDKLTIELKVSLSEDDHNLLVSMQKADGNYPVIRHGINDTPLHMRLSLPDYWSKHDNGFKHILTLDEVVEREESTSRSTVFLFLRSVLNSVAEQQLILDELLKELVARNTISAEDVARIRSMAHENIWEAKREFFRVNDIDELSIT
jgi:hypothetical protein